MVPICLLHFSMFTPFMDFMDKHFGNDNESRALNRS